MTREEAIKILSILKVSYPNFYKNMTKSDAENTIALYQEMFEDCNINLVAIAVKELINSYEYPPTIATIKNKMYELTNAKKDVSGSDLWNCLLNAIRNGYYGANEEFEKLPEIVKEFVKSPIQLRELSEMDSSVINSVVKGQFLKQIENLKERAKFQQTMLPQTKRILSIEVEKSTDLLEEKL